MPGLRRLRFRGVMQCAAKEASMSNLLALTVMKNPEAQPQKIRVKN